MSNFTLLTKYKIVIPVLTILFGVLYRDRLESFFYKFNVSKIKDGNVYTLDQLTQYNGISEEKIYLSFLGSIFDVTTGLKHYGQGAPYHYFVGKDGSRAFVTGNFEDESGDKDHILDLSCNDLFTLKNWKDTLKEKYTQVGVLSGRYYDSNGKETAYMKEYQVRIEQCLVEKDIAKKEELKFPPCNIEWSADAGTRVWCTKTSGGVKRNWVGVPRQLYTPGDENPRCTCINLEDFDNTKGLIKEYDNCHVSSTSCVIKNN